MRALRSGRGRAIAVSAAVTTLLMSGINALAFAAEQDDHGEPGLHSLGFLQAGDLTLANGKHPVATDFANMKLVGSAAPRTMLLLAHNQRSLITISTATLEQTSVLATPATTGRVRSSAVDAAQAKVYLGTTLSGGSDQCQFAVVCLTGPKAEAPQLVTMDLARRTSSVYQFPAAFNATTVVGLTTRTTPAGRTIVYALLYANLGQDAYPGAPGHILELVALDAGRLAGPDTSDAKLWSYPLPSCRSLPGTATNGLQDFLGVTATGDAAYFVCRGNSPKNARTVSPAGAVVVDFAEPDPMAESAVEGFRTSYYPQGAGADFSISGGDEARGLAFLTSVSATNKQYVFNVAHRAWTGSVPFPAVGGGGSNLYGGAADPSTGRSYVVYARDFVISVDAGRLPVPQGAKLALGDLVPAGNLVPAFDPSTRTLFLAGNFRHRNGTSYPAAAIAMYRDVRPVEAPAVAADPDALTRDAPITPQTPVSYAAFASGYGARATFVGGLKATALENAANLGPGLVFAAVCKDVPDSRACFAAPNPSDGSRTIGLGVVDGVEVSNAATKASASSAQIDLGTEADLAAAGHFRPSDDVWNKFGPGGEPPSTPGADAAVTLVKERHAPAECADLNGSNPPPASSNGAQAMCRGTGQQQAAAAAVAPGPGAGSPLQIGYAAASAVVGRVNDIPVTLATAEARGVQLAVPGGPTVDIGSVTTEARSEAAGTTGTARSTFVRKLSNVTVREPSGKVVFGCGFTDANADNTHECDPRQLTDVVSQLSPSPVLFRTPSPDLTPGVKGSPGGAQAAIIKGPYTYWNDFFTNADSGYQVAGLQIIVVGDQAQPSRMVLNLAGVHVESRQLIGVALPPPPTLAAPTLQLSLVDGSTPPVPLSGAAFELRGPAGTAALPCLTGADGIGNCTFTGLTPGDYTVHEATPPPGFAAAPDFRLTLEAGKKYTTTFVNLPAIGSVQIALSGPGESGGPLADDVAATLAGDLSATLAGATTLGTPLADGVFAMFAGASALGTPLATCTTGADGTCGFEKVPLGDYTMQQVSAPVGYLVSEDVSFSLTQPGQVATLKFVDGTPAVAAVPPVVIPGKPAVPPTVIPGKAAVPPKVIPGKPAVPPRTMVLPALDGVTDLPALDPVAFETSSVPPPVVQSQPSPDAMGPLVLGGELDALAGVPAQLARLLVRTPQQAVLLLFVWLVLGLPVYLWTRRRQFITAIEGV
jgi:hypothetical protein